MRYQATHLQGSRYVIRPAGQIGTCGFYPSAWTAVFINARSEADALLKFHCSYAPTRGEAIEEKTK